MRSYQVVLILLMLLFGARLSAAPKKTEVKTAATGQKAEKKKIGVDQSDFMPAANSFGLILTYGADFNQLEQVDQKTVGHRISLAGTYSFDKYWSAYGVIGASHETYDQNIVRDNDNEEFHQISNMNVGAVYSKMKPVKYVMRSSNTLNIGLPVSERARVDKHIANISVTNFLQSYSWKNFSLFNRFSGNFLWNTQRFSIYTNDRMALVGDRLNRDWLLSNSFGVTYMIVPRLGVRFNYRADMVRFLDGQWTLSFGDNLSVFTNLSGFQLFASMINNSYPENERLDVGYYDKYRRIFLGGVTYAF